MRVERKRLKSLYRRLWHEGHCSCCGERWVNCSRSVACIVNGGLTPSNRALIGKKRLDR